jgi:hypothetical protein
MENCKFTFYLIFFDNYQKITSATKVDFEPNRTEFNRINSILPRRTEPNFFEYLNYYTVLFKKFDSVRSNRSS